MFGFFKKLFGPGVDFKELMGQGAIVIDVRSAGEFGSGHLKGSRNIPLDQIGASIAEIKKIGKPIITVCRSGARSSMAIRTLKNAGIECYNGGAWNALMLKIA